ncbi:hypothetical protein AKJ40_01185 [candidate division MSBL1 archaeon SCGC-AAA259M10]|uniref:NADH:quinone oxidoreductase/Mrp antiporter transmembrane domain-containing protein n=2 Tax=candidate division MSBL1 TaxID=215777 RepID=A0A133U6K8_9EURY|nr:hypothetical protein AKJ61_02025 [candidate division MSBL1 archaeon SCGC-AAA259B11]KXB00517.1 hypothetical protein AKJ40_01185 [candidate division MSBL1 archaeon SCGC-AAA259M10]
MIQFTFPILLISTLIPLVLCLPLSLLGDRLRGRTIAVISFILLAIPLATYLVIILKFGLGVGTIDPAYFAHPFVGSFSMLFDSLSAPFALGIAIITPFVALYSHPYMRHRIEEMREEGLSVPSLGTFYALYTMFAAAMLGTVLSTNLLEFYIFLELTLIPSFLLIAIYGYGERVKIAYMYLLWTHIGALVFLFGILYLGISVGTFDILNMQSLTINQALGAGLPMFILVAIVVGLLFKMATFGVHIWLPYAHAEAPTPISALLSPNLIGISGYALVRIGGFLFPIQFKAISIYLMGLAFLTAIYGGLMALAQDDFKRMLAYSSISQMGWLLLGISTLTADGITGSMLLYLTHAFGKSVLFMTAGVIIVRFNGLRSISKMGGLISKVPKVAGLSLIGFMFLVGIPPTLGLWSKILIIIGIFNIPGAMNPIGFLVLVIVLILAAGVTAVYSFVTLKRVFLGDLADGIGEPSKEGWSIMTGIMAIIAGIGVAFFFYPNIIINPLKELLSTILV